MAKTFLTIFLLVLLNGLSLFGDATEVRAQQSKPGPPAVEPGKLFIKSEVPDAKVYVDGVYKGPANTTIEAVPIGEHAISCRTETQSISGTYVIGNTYVHKWEARFDILRFVSIAEREPVQPEAEPPMPPPIVPRVEVPAPKPVKPKKVVAEPVKKEPEKTEEEQRREYLNVIKVAFEGLDEPEARVSHTANPTTIGKYKEEIKKSGAYFRTKKNLLLCETGPCEQQWSSSFQYTDEAGKSDSFSLIWKRTVFSGMTPEGTSRYELVFCLNGLCQTLRASGSSSSPVNTDLGRYSLAWTRSAIAMKRSDFYAAGPERNNK